MNFKKLSLLPKLSLVKAGVTSGASRAVFLYKNDLPLQFRHKKLLNRYKWNAGRSSTGRVVV
jgi:hypothetical protein